MTSPQPKYWRDVSPASPAGLTPVYTSRGCYFNVRSKADMSQLNLPHGTNNKWKTEKSKKKLKKRTGSEVSVYSPDSGESVESVMKKRRKATVRRICRKGRF